MSSQTKELYGWVCDHNDQFLTIRTGVGLSRHLRLKKSAPVQHNDFVQITDGIKYKVISRACVDVPNDLYVTGLVLKCKSILVSCARRILERSGLEQVYVPVLISEPEFPSDDPSYSLGDKSLSQTSQQFLESAAAVVGSCFCIGPSFRVNLEPSPRHLNEFLHLEVEWVGIMSFSEHLKKIRDFMVELIKEFRICASPYLLELKVDLMGLDLSFPVVESEQDMKGPCILVNPPRSRTSFDIKDGMAADIIVPGMGEILGSGVREDDVQALVNKIKETGRRPEDYSKYIMLRVFGHGKTSGFGMGIDRVLAWVLGISDIHKTIIF